MTGKRSLKVEAEAEAAEAATTPAPAGNASSAKNAQLQLTPRFTQEEKDILYSLFHTHEEVIDIKFRKKQRSKYAVRDAWDQIVREFNNHHAISAVRNLKQIQKFWLNARLRKQYPFTAPGQKRSSSAGNTSGDNLSTSSIKYEPEFKIDTTEESEQNDSAENVETMAMEVNNSMQELEEDAVEVHHQQQQQLQHVQQAAATAAAAGNIQAQQISVDQISADKLTLNDLLHFKTARPREEIILQIKHPSDATGTQITLPSPTRISIPTHHQPQQHTMATITASGYNQQIISEIKPQQITLAQYNQAQQQQQLAQQQQQHLAQQQLVVAAAAQQQQQQQQQQVKMQLQTQAAAQQFATATPTFTCTTFNAVPATAPPALTAAPTLQVQQAGNVTMTPATPTISGVTSSTMESHEEKISYYKMKEAELRFKEEQLALEKKKIELNRAQEELKHLREVYRLQVEEMNLKIRILKEEEKQLRKNQSSLSS